MEGGSQGGLGTVRTSASRHLPAAVKPRARAQASWPAPMKPTLMVPGSASAGPPQKSAHRCPKRRVENGGPSGRRAPEPNPGSCPQLPGRIPPPLLTHTHQLRRRSPSVPAPPGRPIRGRDEAACPPPAHGIGGWNLGRGARSRDFRLVWAPALRVRELSHWKPPGAQG